MKSKLTKLSLALVIISAMAFKAYDYRLELTKESMVADWTRARDFTLEHIEAMPEEGLAYRPTDKNSKLYRTNVTYHEY